MSEVKYEDIQKANEAIKTTDIKGKDYAEVPQRIKAFRMVYPMGRIVTRMVSNENGVCIIRAEVFATGDDTIPLGTGMAYEKENSTFINRTSYIENCETSAVGRALGMCGFGIDVSVASAEEVQNAMAQQEAGDGKQATQQPVSFSGKKASANQLKILKEKYTGANLTKLLTNNNIEKIEDLPIEKASEIIAVLMKKGKA